MDFLYHKIPDGFEGNILYPLNTLKEVLPHRYEVEVKKYEGRENLLDKNIPILDCLWNDALHISPIHPYKFKEFFATIERPIIMKGNRYFVIPVELLDQDKTVIYKYETGRMNPSEFIPFSRDELKNIQTIPLKAIQYYKSVERGQPLFVHHFVPHVLYKGNIDISGLDIIEV